MIQQNDEELRILAREIEQYRTQIQQLEQQIQTIQFARERMNTSRETIQELKNKKKDDNILVALRGDVYIQAKIARVDSIIVGIGAEVAIESNLENAEERISIRIKEMEEGIKRYSQLYSQLISNYKEQQEKLQQYLSQPTQKTVL
ncbi:MAG: prefoldin subunit alpha [Candidatus Hodarchaeota archaeon]